MRIKSFVAAMTAITLLLLVPVSSFAQHNPNEVYLPLVTGSGAGEDSSSDDLFSPSATDKSQPRLSRRDREVTVMTRNIFFGADLSLIAGAQTPAQLVVAASNAYQSVIATNFPERSVALAGEIAATQPALIGLQEVALWRTGPAFDPAPAEEVQYDFLQLLLNELASHGLPYEVVAVVSGLDAETPTRLGFDVRLTIRDVVLVRADLKAADLKLLNVQTGHYAAALTLTSPVATFTFPRHWAAVDVKFRGKTFRFITTHLERVAPQIRVAQAQELLAGPANTSLPTIIAGDFNAQPGDNGDAAAIVIAAGFSDIWNLVHPGAEEFTCCHAADLRNAESNLYERIDLVLARGGISAETVEVVGNRPEDKTPSGLWPSDHAGIVAEVMLP